MKSIKNLLLKKIEEIDRLTENAKKSLAKAPEGSLVISTSGGREQYYHKTQKGQKKGSYVSKKNMKLICALAQKDYDKQFLESAERNKKLIERILELLPCMELKDVYFKQSEVRRNLIKPHIMTDEQYIEQWLNAKYTGKEFAQNTPMLITERGERVRSKTEKIIADKLFAMGIPYRYEYPVKIKGYGFVYPDFTLLNVAKREEIYMEHFGMMDNPEYCHKAIKKLEDYAKNGIYQGRKLLVTYETSQYPLNMKVVENMLKEFVLK